MNAGRPGARSRSITLRTPAKVNLGLRLLGRRADGYHLLESVFVPVDLWDELEIERSPGPDETRLELATVPDAELPPALACHEAGADNLAVLAAQAYRRARKLTGGIRIRLHKCIPAGAGLGGGSSDAAAVLRGLERLAGPEDGPALSPTGLAELALGLGADVPYFLAPGPALVGGIGERIEPLAGLPEQPIVLANPGISVATAEVYRVADTLAASLTPAGAGSTMRAFSRLVGRNDSLAAAFGDLLVNDLEPAAIRLCPPIGRWIRRLQEAGALATGMSGSGGTVFGVFGRVEEAAEVAERLAAVREPGSTALPWVRASRLLAQRPSDR